MNHYFDKKQTWSGFFCLLLTTCTLSYHCNTLGVSLFILFYDKTSSIYFQASVSFAGMLYQEDISKNNSGFRPSEMLLVNSFFTLTAKLGFMDIWNILRTNPAKGRLTT